MPPHRPPVPRQHMRTLPQCWGAGEGSTYPTPAPPPVLRQHMCTLPWGGGGGYVHTLPPLGGRAGRGWRGKMCPARCDNGRAGAMQSAPHSCPVDCVWRHNSSKQATFKFVSRLCLINLSSTSCSTPFVSHPPFQTPCFRPPVSDPCFRSLFQTPWIQHLLRNGIKAGSGLAGHGCALVPPPWCPQRTCL
jgi:hypothetical protein